MRFLADMGVSVRVVEWLRESGYDAIHLRDEGLQRLPNGQIFEKALREQRTVLTIDLDFGEIVAGSGGTSVSVILFRLRNTRAEFVVQRLKVTLEQSTQELAQGGAGRGWVASRAQDADRQVTTSAPSQWIAPSCSPAWRREAPQSGSRISLTLHAGYGTQKARRGFPLGRSPRVSISFMCAR